MPAVKTSVGASANEFCNWIDPKIKITKRVRMTSKVFK